MGGNVFTGIFGSIGDSFWSLQNTILVNPDETENVGKRYKTRAAAQTYVATQSPTANNLWTILRGGIDNEDLPPIAYCRILGLENLVLTGLIDGGAYDGANLTKYLIQGCKLTNINLTGANMLMCKDCDIAGCNPTGGTLLILIGRNFISGGDFSTITQWQCWDSIPYSITIEGIAAAGVIFYYASFNVNVIKMGMFYRCSFDAASSFSLTGNVTCESCNIGMNITIPNGITVSMKGGSAKNITIDAGGILNTDGTTLGTVSGDLSGWNDTGKTALSHILPAQIFS